MNKMTQPQRSATDRFFRSVLLLIGAVALSLTGMVPAARALVQIQFDCPNDKNDSICVRDGGVRHIYIYGPIEWDDAVKIGSIDGMLPIDRPFPPIYINSGGGSVRAAEWIGRVLRRRNAAIEGRDMIATSNDATCASACVLIAIGAVSRQFRDVGFHRPSLTVRRPQGLEDVETAPQALMDRVKAYIQEMGGAPEVAKYTEDTPHDGMHYLTYDPTKPRDEQEIVRLGFRMKPDDPEEERRRISGALTLFDTSQQLQIGVRLGEISAARKLAQAYLEGSYGVRRDPEKAVKLFEMAADWGDIRTRHLLGVMLYNGWAGIPVNHEEAARHYLIAARGGIAGSQNNLGFMYFQGKGVPQNFGEAIHWLTRAAEQGEPFAYGSLGEMRHANAGFPPDLVETFKWLKLAVTNMPPGKSRDNDAALLRDVMLRMTPGQIAEGNRLVEAWRPLKQTDVLMKDKEE